MNDIKMMLEKYDTKPQIYVMALISFVLGFLPSLNLYFNIHISFIPIFASFSITSFIIQIQIIKRIWRTNIEKAKKDTNLVSGIYIVSLLLFYFIGLIVIG